MIDNPILKRRDDESQFDYKVRICLAKLNKEIDLDWHEIVDLLGLDCSSDHLRKLSYGYKEMDEHGFLQKVTSIEDNEILDELELKKIELLEERKKLQTIRTEYNKIAREKARRDLLFESVKDGFNRLDVPDPIVDLSYVNDEKSHVLSFGDIHFGKEFQSFNNAYNEEIAMNRMNEIISETVQYLKKEKVNHLHVINGADSVEGMTLRTSQLQSLQSGFTDQVIKFSKFYAKWLRELSKYVKVNLHHITSSNHTELRPFNSGRGEYPSEDMERIIGMYVHDVLEGNDRINVNTYDNGIVDFSIFNYNICGLHGHQIKSNKSIIKDLSHHRRKFYDYAFISHFHHGNGLTVGEGKDNNIQVIQVPSVMGSDPYSDTLLTGAKAGALITTFTKGKGKTDLHDIILN